MRSTVLVLLPASDAFEKSPELSAIERAIAELTSLLPLLRLIAPRSRSLREAGRQVARLKKRAHWLRQSAPTPLDTMLNQLLDVVLEAEETRLAAMAEDHHDPALRPRADDDDRLRWQESIEV